MCIISLLFNIVDFPDSSGCHVIRNGINKSKNFPISIVLLSAILIFFNSYASFISFSIWIVCTQTIFPMVDVRFDGKRSVWLCDCDLYLCDFPTHHRLFDENWFLFTFHCSHDESLIIFKSLNSCCSSIFLCKLFVYAMNWMWNFPVALSWVCTRRTKHIKFFISISRQLFVCVFFCYMSNFTLSQRNTWMGIGIKINSTNPSYWVEQFEWLWKWMIKIRKHTLSLCSEVIRQMDQTSNNLIALFAFHCWF